MQTKRICRKCGGDMYPYGVYLNRVEYDGHVCTVCGRQVYKRKLKIKVKAKVK